MIGCITGYFDGLVKTSQSIWTSVSAAECCVKYTFIAILLLGVFRLLQIDLGVLRALRYITFSANPKRFGTWAVVTGATDGIGLAIAKRLAKKGMKVVLIGRSADKLKAASEEIAKYKTEVKTIQADLGDKKVFDDVVAPGIKDLEIGVLVNNVGASYDHADYLTAISREQVDQLIALNVVATTYMTKLVLPSMEARKRGAVINISSAAGSLPTGDPLYAVYSATKAYVDAFSKSLYYELKGKGVIVQSQIPYFVPSKLSKIRHSSVLIPKADRFAVSSVNSIGLGPVVVPYWAHAIQDCVIKSLPVAIVEKFVLSHHFGIRKRALKKKAESEKKQE